MPHVYFLQHTNNNNNQCRKYARFSSASRGKAPSRRATKIYSWFDISECVCACPRLARKRAEIPKRIRPANGHAISGLEPPLSVYATRKHVQNILPPDTWYFSYDEAARRKIQAVQIYHSNLRHWQSGHVQNANGHTV